eukprot:1815768-Amphidinium_carterae.1
MESSSGSPAFRCSCRVAAPLVCHIAPHWSDDEVAQNMKLRVALEQPEDMDSGDGPLEDEYMQATML